MNASLHVSVRYLSIVHIKAYYVVQADIGNVHVRIKLVEANTNVSTRKVYEMACSCDKDGRGKQPCGFRVHGFDWTVYICRYFCCCLGKAP